MGEEVTGPMDEDERSPELPESLALALRSDEMWAEPPADLEASVMAALRAESAGGTATAAPVAPLSVVPPRHAAPEAPSPADPIEPVDELAAARERRRLRRFSPRMLLAAAAVVAAAAVGTVWLTADRGGSDATIVALTGTPLEPDATGSAAITSTPSGFEIVLDISDLPPAPAGTYYQAWLKNDAGAVTIGTFHGREGSDDIVLWSGVDPAVYPTLTVTIQQEGAGPQSSGQVVLSGTIAED